MFLIDFDNTLFNTTTSEGNFRDVRVKALASIGISEELYQETYDQARAIKGEDIAGYNDERHAEALAQHGFEKETVLKVLRETMGDKLKTFLFPDTIEFLESLKKTGQPLVLISLGDPEFQYLKFRGSGIEKYFDRVKMTPIPKKEVLHELLEHVHQQPVWFINDRLSENKDIAKLFPEVRVISKASTRTPREEYKESGLSFFDTLVEIKDYIENYE